MRKTRGFTLIELLVAVALLVILTGVVVFVFSRAVRIFIVADARAQIYQNIRAGVDMMRRDLMTSEALVRADGTTSNQQRVRFENATYTNAKWNTKYPADIIQVWNLKSALANGTSGSVYAKYWLDHAANPEVPILKRRTLPVNTTAGSSWMTSNDPTDPAEVREELMQYVVGFDVELYYTNYMASGATISPDPHWNLAGDADDAALMEDGVYPVNNAFKDAANSPAKLFIVQYNPGTSAEVFPGASPWAAGIFNVSSIQQVSTDAFAKRAYFATSASGSVANPNGVNGRGVPALPRALRLTFYVRDEHSNEQRAIQQTIWMPMWGS